jgi:5-methylthioadenosine/S-adenosylhomocysteine deaminase
MSPGTTDIDLLIEARWVVPVEPHAVVLENHAIAVDGGVIMAIRPIAEARASYAPRERVELPEHALIPGLVNSHTHNPMTLLRGLADDLPLMTWLQQHIWPAEAKVIGRSSCAMAWSWRWPKCCAVAPPAPTRTTSSRT